MLCCSQHCLTIAQKKTSMWKILCLCDELEAFLDSENEALSDGKEWKVTAKSSVDLNEDGSKYWARTNDAYHRNLTERKALANEIRNVVKVLMPLCLGRVEDVFALFFKSAVWIRADEKRKCIRLSISCSFHELFKRWTEKALLSEKFFRRRKSWNIEKVCLLCPWCDRLVRCCAI